ncbi:hypothetical protein ABK040_004870 [Willaertia magna]
MKLHSCVFACGYNSSGFLGFGESSDHMAFEHLNRLEEQVLKRSNSGGVIQISLQFSTSWFLTENGDVYLSSYNSIPTLYSFFTKIRENQGNKVITIQSGQNLALFLLDNGQVFQVLSRGPAVCIASSSSTTTTLTDNEVFINKQIRSISVGGQHSFLIDYQNNVYGLGEIILGGESNRKPMANLNFDKDILNYKDTLDFIVSGGNSSVFITKLGDVYIWGEKRAFGQLENDSIDIPTKLTFFDKNVLKATCGWYFTVFLTKRNQLFVCGYNSYGQCNESSLGISVPLKEVKLPITNYLIDNFSAGSDHLLISTLDNQIFTIGMNQYGQLGINSKNESYSSVFRKPIFLFDKCDNGISLQEYIYNHIGTNRYKIEFAQCNYNTLSSYVIFRTLMTSRWLNNYLKSLKALLLNYYFNDLDIIILHDE